MKSTSFSPADLQALSVALPSPESALSTLSTSAFRRHSALLFVDRSVNNADKLLQAVQPGTEVYVLDNAKDAIGQITQTLLGRSGISSLQILSHGAVGGLQLGKDWLDRSALQRYMSQLQTWNQALTPDADILLYGCNVAADSAGQAFVDWLSQITQADVAASHDLTGSAALGGDWTLEYHTGKIETSVVLNPSFMRDYHDTLATITVNSTADTVAIDGIVTLREAITSANNNAAVNADVVAVGAYGTDTINFEPTIFGTARTITLTAALPNVSSGLTIQGTGANLLTISGNNAFRVFFLNGNITISDLTIANGRDGGSGAGILYNGGGTLNVVNSILRNHRTDNVGSAIASWGGTVNLTNTIVTNNSTTNDGTIYSWGALNLLNSTVAGNNAANGGGIVANSVTTLTNSTISGNTATNNAGGLLNSNQLTISNSTISGNRATGNGGGISITNGQASLTNTTIANNIADADNNGSGNGGGISVSGGTVNIRNTIVAGNFDTPNNTGTASNSPDVFGTFTDQGNNLISKQDGSSSFTTSTLVGTIAAPINPLLGPLQNNGGVTQTQALLTGSSAIDAGSSPNTAAADQRGTGFARIVNGTVDIGAVEYNLPTVRLTATDSTAAEATPANDLGTYEISRSHTSGALTVKLAIDGISTATTADYTLSVSAGSISVSGSIITVVIPDGVASINLILTVVDDAATEAAETLKLNLLTDPLYTINSSNNTGTVTLAASDPIAPLSVVINEIAWMGTTASDTDEWVELYNPTSSPINLTNWTLTAAGGAPAITFAADKTIAAGSYFLLERTNDDTISGVVANQIYTGALLNAGDRLTLRASDGNVIDTANTNGGAWSAGVNVSTIARFTMERINPMTVDTDGNWRTNDGFTRNGVDASSNPIYGTPGAANSLGAIPKLSISSTSLNEGNSGTTNATLTISLSHPTSQAVTVNYSPSNGTATIADGDYTSSTGAVTFNPGETSKPIALVISGDSKFELNETFTVNLSSPVNATLEAALSQGEVTIVNDDAQPILSITDVSQTEGNSGSTTYTFTVNLTGSSDRAATVDYATTDGTATIADNDYTATSGALTFNPGETSKTVIVNVNSDSKLEPDQTFTVDLSNASNAMIAIATGIGTISNDDVRPTISIANVTQNEGNSGTTAYLFTVSLSNASDESVSLNYATADGTAIAASQDFTATAGQLIFAAGETSKTITVLVQGDHQFELDETFLVRLNNANNASLSPTANQAIGTILNDDGKSVYQFTTANFVTQEGNTTHTTNVVTIARSNNINTATTIDVIVTSGTATIGSDVATQVVTVNFAAGQTIAVVPMQILGDSLVEANETINLTLANPGTTGVISNTQSIASLTIGNDDVPIVPVVPIPVVPVPVVPKPAIYNFSTASFRTVEGNSISTTSVVTVTRTGNQSIESTVGVKVGHQLMRVKFAAGQTIAVVPIQIVGDTKVEADEAIELSLVSLENRSVTGNSASLVLVNDDVAAPVFKKPTFKKGKGKSGLQQKKLKRIKKKK